jgi:hypothetical protein
MRIIAIISQRFGETLSFTQSSNSYKISISNLLDRGYTLVIRRSKLGFGKIREK